MSGMTDAEHEQDIRDNVMGLNPFGGDYRFLLRLLDAERARADAAETKAAHLNHILSQYESSARSDRARADAAEAKTAEFVHVLDQYEHGKISKVACVSLMLNVT